MKATAYIAGQWVKASLGLDAARKISEHLTKLMTHGVIPEVDTAIGEAMAEMGTYLIQRTPVKTGRARAGWVGRLNEPSEYAPPKRPETTRESQGDEYEERLVRRWHNSMRRRKFWGKKFYVTNRVKYIELLEHGTSKQAREGFLLQAMVVAEQNLKRAIEDLFR